MSALSKFKGGLAVITGAGGGLGSGLARHAASAGMKVIVADIAFQNAETVARNIRAEGGQAEAARIDVSDPDALESFADSIYKSHGHPRLLINNAAIETLGLCWEVPKERWEATLNVNIHGTVHGVRAFLPKMIASDEECWIVNVASTGAFASIPTQTAYIMTKHAIQAFTEGLYLDLQLKNPQIHVSTACPGLLRTEIFNGAASAVSHLDDRLARYQQFLSKLAHEKRMSPDEASASILKQVADGEFWVWTHEEHAKDFLSLRSHFLAEQKNPHCPEGARHLLNFEE